VEGAGAKAPRIPLRKVGAFSDSLPIPADASGAYHPDPQVTTELAPGPPSLKGYTVVLRIPLHTIPIFVYVIHPNTNSYHSNPNVDCRDLTPLS
jgi:hypothetical protein